MFVCDVGSAIAQLFEVSQTLKNSPVSDIQIISKKHYQSLLGDREKAYKIGLAFTRSQEELLCELQETQNDLSQKREELDKLQEELEAERRKGKRELAVSVGALLKEQDEAREALESLRKIIAELTKELEQYRLREKKHKQGLDDSDIPIFPGYGDMEISRKRQRTGDSPAKLPSSTQGRQPDSIEQLIATSQKVPRTLYIKFTRYHPSIDELMSEIIPGQVESVYWNTPSPGHRFAFVNFLSRPGAREFLDYVDQNPTHLPPGLTIEWGLKLKPMTSTVVEAITNDGATRILRINGVPIDTQHEKIWSMAGKTTFRFVRVIQKHEHCVDIALEFNGVEDALQAREALSSVDQLRKCLFSWGSNVTDHLVNNFIKTRSGDGRVIRVSDTRVTRADK